MGERAPRVPVAARLACLALVATACGAGVVAFARGAETAPAAAHGTPPARVVHRSVAAPAACAGRLAARTWTRRLERPLAALVAPVSTVRLADPVRQTPPLGASLYVFPVRGQRLVVDTFGALRAGVDWHHGDDIFAPRGTPVLAVADGVVFSVGRQRLGGKRLWLLDRAGNEFYFAHLDSFSPLAVNGQDVRAGDVLGTVGNTGDAERTPPHLHFEIHPSGLLGLGYDGAVDPTRYLRAWRPLGAAAARPARCATVRVRGG